MKIYLTVDSLDVLKKYYLKDIKEKYEIINIRHEISVLNCHNYKEDTFQNFILNQNILTKFNRYFSNKRNKIIIYILEEITEDFIIRFKEFLYDKKIFLEELNLLDYHNQVDNSLHTYFLKIN